MNRKLLSTAVGGTLALAAGAAQAWNHADGDFALVPYVVKDANRTTVVTAIMSSHANSASDVLHLQYHTKSTTDANTAACQPSSVTVPVTNLDIVTWDTAGILGYPLFNDSTNPAPLGVSISYAAPRHGFLIIETSSLINSGNMLNAAYWMELDLGNGGAHGDAAFMRISSPNYAGLNNQIVLEPAQTNNLARATAVPFWPSSVASTAFTVTPLGTDMLNKENNQVVVQVFNDNGVQGAYDRNENGVDGTVPITIRCVGRVTPAQLMPGVVANTAWAAQGGWGFLANLGDGDATADETQGGTNSGDLDAMVYQVDSSSAGGKFLSNATRIASDQGATGN